MSNCLICGAPILEGGVIPSEAPHIILCDNCGRACYTCATCSSGPICKAQENPEHIQPVILKTFQQGGMTIQTQVINPAIFEAYCKKGCECWNGSSCFKQSLNCCDKHTFPQP